MSTRGVCIIRKGGKDKGIYIHSDAYPDGFGSYIITMVQDHDDGFLGKLFDGIVFGGSKPEAELDWHLEDAVYNTERGALSYFDGDNTSSIADSLYSEYAYCLNLDDGTLEYYTGFHQAKDPKGAENRYAGMGQVHPGYEACHLAKTFPFSVIRHGKDGIEKNKVRETIVEAMEAWKVLCQDRKKGKSLAEARERAEKCDELFEEWGKQGGGAPAQKDGCTGSMDDVLMAIDTLEKNIGLIKPSKRTKAKLALLSIKEAFEYRESVGEPDPEEGGEWA